MKYSSLLALPCIAIISACSSSSSKNEEPNVNPTPNQQQQPNPTPTPTTTRVSASDADNMGAVNEAGTLLTAQTGLTTGVSYDNTTNTGTLGTKTFSVKKGADGEAIMYVDGTEYKFTASDRDTSSSYEQYYNKEGPNQYGLRPYEVSTIDEALDNASLQNLAVWEYNVQTGDGATDSQGFAVVGVQTNFAAVANNAEATYSGNAYFKAAANYSQNYSDIKGDVGLTVNFSDANISGNINNLQLLDAASGNWTGFTGSMALDETAIDANSEFGGDVTLDTAAQATFGFLPNGGTATYGGSLFGTEAQQAGGTINITSNANSDGFSINTYGYFAADKD